MANKTFNDLPAASGLTGTEIIPLIQAGIDSRTTAQSIANLVSGSTGWSLSGNSGTTAGTNFIGTTDAKDLVFKVNNNEIARFKTSNYKVQFGYQPTAFGDYSSIGGGYSNSTSGVSSTICNGEFNIISNLGQYATIGGGTSNTVRGYASVIGGGSANLVSSDYSSILGGDANVATGNTCTVVGGFDNAAHGKYSTVGSGRSNYAKSYGGFVIGVYNDATASTGATFFDPLNRAFEIGIGTADNARANAMTVLFNGNVGVGTLTPTSRLHVSGQTRISGMLEYADNAAALSGGLTVGMLYRTGDLLKIVH